MRAGALALLAAVLLAGCGGDPGTGPVEVRWDRDACERCRMVVSDRHYAAQVRAPDKRVYHFDDIGCAVIWLDEQPWRADPAVEIWVAHFQSGEWLDARAAHFLPARNTPMDYGLGATREAAAGALDFTGAREHILAVERSFHTGEPRSVIEAPQE